MTRLAVVLFLLLACSDPSNAGDAPGAGDAPAAQGVRLEEVASGLDAPVFLTAPPGDARLFVVEQPGRIRVIEGGRLLAAPFLDISARVGYGGERGLLGLAFHPDYARNGYLYVNYTDRAGNTQIERYRVGADRNVADPASARRLFSVDQPYSNHNGGMLAFGPDGMLYVGMGDGGSGGDPHGYGQSLTTRLGKLLRVDVDRADPYGIPADNPYVNRPGVPGEIWAVGVRNPWRFSFDRSTGQLYVADVGQNRWEEISVVDGRQKGLNYGWNVMEGAHCFRGDGCGRAGLVQPVVEYPHPDGCSVTGGYVYRGRRLPALAGHYFYGDFCEGWVRSFRLVDGVAQDRREWKELGGVGNILSFGEDAAGELYLLSARGRVYRFAPA